MARSPQIPGTDTPGQRTTLNELHHSTALSMVCSTYNLIITFVTFEEFDEELWIVYLKLAGIRVVIVIFVKKWFLFPGLKIAIYAFTELSVVLGTDVTDQSLVELYAFTRCNGRILLDLCLKAGFIFLESLDLV